MDALECVARVPFFQKLTDADRQAIAALCRLQKYVQGNIILKQGDLVTQFYLVAEGRINLRLTERDGLERPAGSVGPGDYFGVKMFTTQEPADFTFEALGTAAVWILEREAWELMIETHPDVLERMPELSEEYARLTRGLEWLSPGEVTILVTRRHWWALFLSLRAPLALAAVFTLAFIVSSAVGVSTRLPFVLPAYGTAIALLLLWGGITAVNWYLQAYIVTNKRVARVDRDLVFSDRRSDIAIEKIQSQRVDRGGPISVLLNISDLRITSASSDTAGVVFHQVGNVERIQRAIDSVKTRAEATSRAMQRERLRAMIERDLHHHVFAGESREERPPAPPSTRGGLRALLDRILPPDPRALIRPRTLSASWRGLWASLLGTEIRQGGVVTWRKHYIVLLGQVWPALLLMAIAVGLFLIVVAAGVPFGLAPNGIYAVLFVLFGLAVAYFLWQLQDWRVDQYCLTDSDIIDTVSLPLGLRYDEKRAPLRNIQDINTARKGLLNTLLDFGNVEVRVAGNAAPFTFDSVVHPRRVADEIQERIEVMKARSAERATREQSQNIVDSIIAYHRLVTLDRVQNAPAGPALPEPVPASGPALVPPPLSQEDHEFPPETELPHRAE